MLTSRSGQEGCLPLELLETIVDAVGLACLKRRPVPRCRQYLFRVVRFDHSSAWASGYTYPRPDSSRVQAFLALLTEPQSDTLGAPIAAYIRVLRIENNFSPLFPQITALLPNLQEFYIRLNSNGHTEKLYLEYQALHEVAGGNVEGLDQDMINTMVSNDQTVNEVMKRFRDTRWLLPLSPLRLNRLYINADFSSVDVFPILSFILRCLHLESRPYTVLDAIRWPLPNDAAIPRREVSVRRLELYGNRCLGLLRYMMGPEYFRKTLDNLEYLNLQLLGGDLHERSFLPLLSHCSASLQGLEVNLTHCETDEYALEKLDGLDISILPNLKHLNLVNWPRSAQQKLTSLPSGIASLLSVYGASPSLLETIQISIQRRKSRLNEPVDWTDSDGSWARLKQLIMGTDSSQRAPAFRNLVSLDVSFTLRDFVSGRPERHAEASEAANKARKLLTLGAGVEASVILVP